MSENAKPVAWAIRGLPPYTWVTVTQDEACANANMALGGCSVAPLYEAPVPPVVNTVRECDYWRPIREGGIALPCNCGMGCDGPRPVPPVVEDAAKLADLLREAAYDIECYVRDGYGYPDVHPAMQRKYERDVAIVSQLRTAAETLTAALRPERGEGGL